MAILSAMTAVLAASFLPPALGHAGGHTEEEIRAEISLRNIVSANSKRALDRCSNTAAALALRERAIARRTATAHALRAARNLQNEHILTRRDRDAYQKWSSLSHNLTGTESFTLSTDVSTIFASNATCALVPETVIGPYYVAGELLRTDITDGQAGVPVHLDIQFVDIATCAGVSSLLIDAWHCNATGVYSGVAATGQGGLDTTHGRGVQQSDGDGVVQFDTIFPGHYSGRATHIHIMATADAEVLPNKTFTGGTARHIGQMYFDDDLRDAVEALSPYSTNSQPVTTNAEDSLAPDEATAEYDPFLNYVMLGSDVSDGLLMWITVGLDTSADYSSSVSAAAHYYEDGGVAENNGMGGGGGGGPGGPGGPGVSSNGTGAPPTGTSSPSSTTASSSPTSSAAISTSVSVAAAATRRILGLGW